MDNQGYQGYPGEEHFYNQGKLPPPRPFWRRHLWPIVASAALVVVIILASTTTILLAKLSQHSAIPAPVPPATTPTPIPPGVTPPPPTEAPTSIAAATATVTGTATGQTASGLPCIVNMSTWTGGSQDWTVHNGVLYNDGTNDNAENGPTIIAPCQPGVPNYRVEAKIQVTRSLAYGSDCFGVVFRGSSSQNGWQGYKTDICGDATADISAYGDYNALTQAPFTVGTTMHTYRIDVQDNSIKLFIDGNLVDTVTDNRLLTDEAGQGVGLFSQDAQLQVNSFEVTALT